MSDSESGYDNSDVWWLWGILIGLYFLISAIVALGWIVIAVPVVLLLVALMVVAYLDSEFHRYRKYRSMQRRAFRAVISKAKRL